MDTSVTSRLGMEENAEGCPTISVIIPAKNEERTIKKTIKSINALEYPAELIEIIVVDNGSDDATAEIARKSGATVIEHPGIRVGAVRNRGAEFSSGKILVFLDADIIVQPCFLKVALENLREEAIGAVGGRYTVTNNATWVERAWVVERKIDSFETEALPGGSFALKRSVFEQTGGFNEILAAGEDDELTRRIAEAGYRVISIRGCDVEHLGYPTTLSGVFHRQVWHGSSQLDSAQTYRDPILLLTHGFAVGIFTIPFVFYYSGASAATGFVTALPFTLCGVAALAKEKKSNKFHTLRLVQRSILYFPFFLGRSLGLIINYRRWIANYAASRPRFGE